jgi:predicted adenylyl cyclase CyaB
MVEIEVKLRISSIRPLKERLLALGVKLDKERSLEENTLYDFSCGSLTRKRQALRLRTVGKKTFLTFKGPPLKSRKFKIREEFETEVKNAKQQKKILNSLGLIPAFSYKKHRTVFRKKNLKICLDETSVGHFIELEGKRKEIVQFAKSLGFSKKEFIQQDYIQLIKAHRGNG